MKIFSWVLVIGLVALCGYEIYGLVKSLISKRKASKNKKREVDNDDGSGDSSSDN